ncbi:MAG TPA: nucleotidyl transferase AbiEii/AbiGii toxin family protein [Pyrinomonadaceae bacterium]
MSDLTLPASFVGALEALTDWLDDEQVPYTAIGGVAVSLLAQPRATQDIDAVVWLDEKKWESFFIAGKAYGFEPRLSDVIDFAAKARVLLLRHQISGISIDISLGALPFEREMIERAVTLEIGALKLKVPTPEDLIITKAVAQRPKDIADIEAILNIHQHLDLLHIRRWTKEFADALEAPELLENLERILRMR